MNTTEMKKFTREVLNESGLRSKLREKVPCIDRLESLESLRNLSLTRMETEPSFTVWYEGIASQELYPHVKTKLIKKGIINRNNVPNSSVQNKNQQNEYEKVRFGISGNSIQVIIKVYNPDYKSSR